MTLLAAAAALSFAAAPSASLLTPPPLPAAAEPAPWSLPASRRHLELRLPGSRLWVIAGALSGVATFATLGGELDRALSRGTERAYGVPHLGILAGSVAGLVGGYALGYLAKRGWVSARIATLVLMAVGAASLGGEVFQMADGFSSGRYHGPTIGFGGLLPMY